MTEITSFKGVYRFLSNFYITKVEYEGEIYPSAEHAFQAAKTLDPDLRNKIAARLSPGEAKRLGQMIPFRPMWDNIKIQVMSDILTTKFSDPVLAKRLIATYPAFLIEGNNWNDRFWGATWLDNEWVGHNNLGWILMELRKILMEKDK